MEGWGGFMENVAVTFSVPKSIYEWLLTLGAYLVPITEIVSDCQQAGTGALLIINNYILDLLWVTSAFFYLTLIAKMELEECQPQVQQFC